MKKICLVCTILIVNCLIGTGWAEMLIITHQDVPETTFMKKDIQEIFLGKQVQWADNSTIRVVTVKIPEIHEAFLAHYLKKSVSQWNTYWKRMIFTGQGTPPEEAETQEELFEYVVNTPGAVGYIDVETPVENVNIIEVR